MKNTYRVVVIGSERSISMLRRLSTDLAQEGCDLMATSSFSLGGNFVIMMIINSDLSKTEQRDLLQPTADSNKLQLIVDSIDDFDPTHDFPEVSVNIHGTDRIGVFSYCMAILNDAGLEVISMHSDLLGKATEGKEEEFLNIINGRATLGMEELNRAAENLRNNKIDITITSVDLENEE
jgi:predicted amino acid-binding ACT domain protein